MRASQACHSAAADEGVGCAHEGRLPGRAGKWGTVFISNSIAHGGCFCAGAMGRIVMGVGVCSSTSGLRAWATQGRHQPSAFSSALKPGQAMVYATTPSRSGHRQARQVPLRHALGSSKPAASAACSRVCSALAWKRSPPGLSATSKRGRQRPAVVEFGGLMHVPGSTFSECCDNHALFFNSA